MRKGGARWNWFHVCTSVHHFNMLFASFSAPASRQKHWHGVIAVAFAKASPALTDPIFFVCFLSGFKNPTAVGQSTQ
jgi:hypothetical protein